MRAYSLMLLLALTGCSAMSPTQLGHAVGGIAGSLIAPGVGAPLGALVGTLGGLLVEGQVDKAREGRERGELGQQLGAPPIAPTAASTVSAMVGLPAPSVARQAGMPTRVWVDEQFKDGRLITGHFEVRPIP